MNWHDITLHTVPTFCIGALLGFSAAGGINYLPPASGMFMAGVLFACTVYCSWLWLPRERAQHGGQLGGKQSKFEAYVPLIAGPCAFTLSIILFLLFPI
jgi:hypothetical protein